MSDNVTPDPASERGAPQPAHSPLPWTWRDNDGSGVIIYDANGAVVSGGWLSTDAAFIVSAVNASASQAAEIAYLRELQKDFVHDYQRERDRTDKAEAEVSSLRQEIARLQTELEQK